MPILATALSGGLAGALVTLGIQGLKRWWLKPVLEILFSQNEAGCLIETNLVGGNQLVRCYVRLKVRNRGRTTADNVSVCVEKLGFSAPGLGVRTFDEE